MAEHSIFHQVQLTERERKRERERDGQTDREEKRMGRKRRKKKHRCNGVSKAEIKGLDVNTDTQSSSHITIINTQNNKQFADLGPKLK